MIDAKTIPFYLLGYPVEHSKSPLMQNAALSHYNINGVYLTLEVSPDDFDIIADGLKKQKIGGLNITLPHKHAIMKFCDRLSDDAKAINAVNTVEVIDGVWTGHNTDWYGVYKTLEIHTIPTNQKVLIIGAGGASPGVIYGLHQYGITDITITNRTLSKAEALKDQFDIELLNYNKIRETLTNYSMIINSTSIHFNTIVDTFDDNTVYFDLKYYTEDINIKNYIDGANMLLYQGAKAFTIWTQKKAPIDIMQNALQQ